MDFDTAFQFHCAVAAAMHAAVFIWPTRLAVTQSVCLSIMRLSCEHVAEARPGGIGRRFSAAHVHALLFHRGLLCGNVT